MTMSKAKAKTAKWKEEGPVNDMKGAEDQRMVAEQEYQAQLKSLIASSLGGALVGFAVGYVAGVLRVGR